MTINDRIKQIVQHFNGGNVNAFCNDFGLKQSTISNITGTRQSDPSFKTLNTIVLKTHVSVSWLMLEKGSMFNNASEENKLSAYMEIDYLKKELAAKDQMIQVLKDHIATLKSSLSKYEGEDKLTGT